MNWVVNWAPCPLSACQQHTGSQQAAGTPSGATNSWTGARGGNDGGAGAGRT
jgi:hypothetical protein